MRLRTNNRFRGLRGDSLRHKPGYAACERMSFGKQCTVRMLSAQEIAEFQEAVRRAINGNFPKAKPL